jgi:hypothetical protein
MGEYLHVLKLSSNVYFPKSLHKIAILCKLDGH